MTEAPANAGQVEPAEFLELWSASVSQVMGQISGSAVPCQVRSEAPPDLTPPGESDSWVAVTCSGSLRGEVILRMAGATVLRLAQIFMSEPPTPGAQVTADHREAVVELLRQISGIVSSTAKARWGEFQLLVEPAAGAPSWASARTFWLEIGEDGPTGMAVEFCLSPALVAELRAENTEAAKSEIPKAETAPAEADSTSTVVSPTTLADSVPGIGAMELLMDVQLAMTLRFGAKRLLLREVLDLNPGSVVELDRKVQEPVDLLLDGRLIARGEVVVIDGNYGLRVTDVSPLGPG